MSAGRVIVPLRHGSDGDATHRPVSQAYKQINPPTMYLEKLGVQWMEARREALPGVAYILERLPAGYTLWQRPRTKDPTVLDKYLYGHPSQITFDSPNRFFPHFKYLMENRGSNIGCPCTVCNAKGGVVPPIRAPTTTGITSQPKGRPKLLAPGMNASRVDEEGTPDIYRNLIDKLKSQGNLDEAITEPMSLDWKAEQAILPEILEELQQNPQWLPRRGDIVLYVRRLPAGVEMFHDSGEFKLRHIESGAWVGHPSWEAGVIGQTPAERVSIEDLVREYGKKQNVSSSGVRVEPIPSPNNNDKSLSKQYEYIPLHYTRPFVFWADLLGSIPEEKWHPTIKNALTTMSSFSLMGKHHFRGTWPEAQIYCHAIYVGAEMIAVGDTVRLMPKSGMSCTDVLTIKSIRLKLSNLDVANSNDYDEGRPYNSSIFIYGTAYTSDPHRTTKEWFSTNHPPRKIIHEDDPWQYPLHPPTKEMQIPFSRIVGRLFETEAMILWFPHLSKNTLTSLSQGIAGMQEAREFSRKNDRRITEQFGATWFWGDTRAEALDLHTINGLETSKYDTEREPKEWRKQIKAAELMNLALEKTAGHEDRGSAVRSLRAFAATLPPTNSSVKSRSLAHSVSGSASGSSAPAGVGQGQVSRKRTRVVDLSSEDEDVIRQQTRIVEEKAVDKSGSERHKNRVMVVIR